MASLSGVFTMLYIANDITTNFPVVLYLPYFTIKTQVLRFDSILPI